MVGDDENTGNDLDEGKVEHLNEVITNTEVGLPNDPVTTTNDTIPS